MSKTKRRVAKGEKFHIKSGRQGQTFTPRDLMSVNPLNEQFEPTEASPIPQRQKMGGVS